VGLCLGLLPVCVVPGCLGGCLCCTEDVTTKFPAPQLGRLAHACVRVCASVCDTCRARSRKGGSHQTVTYAREKEREADHSRQSVPPLRVWVELRAPLGHRAPCGVSKWRVGLGGHLLDVRDGGEMTLSSPGPHQALWTPRCHQQPQHRRPRVWSQGSAV
jgi:hypothetical protein